MKRKNFFGILTVTLLSAAMFSLAGCKDGGDTPPPPPPPPTPTDPSTIAAANLIAYFPFESETASIDKGTGITFNKNVGGSFPVGRRGNSYKGGANVQTEAYLLYDVGANNPFASMNEFTIACWIKGGANGGTADKIFSLNGGEAWQGSLTIMQESNPEAITKLDMKAYMYSAGDYDWKGQDVRLTDEAFPADKWFHYVMSYNKTTSMISVYSNASLIYGVDDEGNPVAISQHVCYSGPDPGTGDPQPLLGPMIMADDISKIYIGAWSVKVEGIADETWMTWFAGQLDELRIYNKCLSDTEIKDLYNAEVENINK